MGVSWCDVFEWLSWVASDLVGGSPMTSIQILQSFVEGLPGTNLAWQARQCDWVCVLRVAFVKFSVCVLPIDNSWVE